MKIYDLIPTPARKVFTAKLKFLLRTMEQKRFTATTRRLLKGRQPGSL